MDHNNAEILKDPGGKPGLTADWENSESFSPEKEQWRCSSCTATEDLTTNGSWSQSSISRSLQRAETLLRSTFNPSLKWLFHGRSQDEEEEEGNFVVAHNLVSRSSARLLRLQQALLTVAPQWQLVGRAQTGSPQVCVKGLPAEGSVLLLPSSSSFLQGHYRALWRLLEQRSLLLFIHEYTRRARLTAAYISRVSQLLNQNPSNCSSFRVGLGSLCQELRVHLNHWSCLSSKVQSDHYLRLALIQQATLLLEIRQTLDLLGLQALVVMEHYVHAVLSAIAQTELDYVPREVLEDILAGTDLYNQAVEEQRAQHSTTQLRTAILQQARYSTPDSSLPNSRRYHPAAFSVKELMKILAVHHAEMAAKQLLDWVSEQSYHICNVHCHHEAHIFSDNPISQVSRLSCGTITLRSKWTWEQLLHSYLISAVNPYSPLQSPAHHTSHKTRSNFPNQCQTYIFQTNVDALNSDFKISNLEKQTSLENCKLSQTVSPPSTSPHHLSTLPLSGFCQQDQSSVELLFQVLVSSNDLLAPLVSHTPTPEGPAEQLLPHTTTTDVLPKNGKTDPMISTAPITDSVVLSRLRTELNEDQNVEESQQEWADLETTTRPEATPSSGFGKDGDPEKEVTLGAEGTPDWVCRPRSVQWSDLGQSLVFADLFEQYRTLLWTLCSKALWLQLHVPPAGNTAGGITFHDNHRRFQILHMISQASKTDLVPMECRTMLEDFSLRLLVSTAYAQWDYVVCRSLGSALKDKCLIDVNQGSRCMTLSSKQDGSVMMSETMEHFLQLSPPFLSSLCCHQSNSRVPGCFSLLPCRFTLQRQAVSLALATVQLSTAWVMSKAYQFLSSWSLNKFLLITQGDLKVLRESVDMIVQLTKSLMMNSDNDHHSTLHDHNQLLLRQQLRALDRAVSELQTFSSLVLKTFSSDCKKMSGEIFEQTMPSAVHWRPNHRTGFPSSPSEYAALAAQTVIGQVLEGVAPLSDDARVQALSITMTAFMEAWMEHILKQKIKFSVQGALQLKQDFDSIKELIQSDKYGLPAELHQRLLSLRVFQQVDSAVICLLQQPQAKPYLQSRAWEPFTRCCPTNSSRNSINAAVKSSITNLRSMEGEDMTHSDLSVTTTDLPPVDPSTPGEPYLAPSVALGAAQQEWLDLRIHHSARRWRLPGLQCLSKSEP
ncbi:uncharacterized protein ccdc142 isoform X2 [Thunnus albacares]|uniref:uncharacterized protein ccdc142 isoform X2 n=1 Tax=Thunnus albacares TaxID=8236 RepID=UPI001CF6A1D5|nr:uncharacterized protein ccdc142 isoform X2 [Thunnus albacares]